MNDSLALAKIILLDPLFDRQSPDPKVTFRFHPPQKQEVESELPKVLIKVLFWALLKVLLLGKVPFKVLKKVL